MAGVGGTGCVGVGNNSSSFLFRGLVFAGSGTGVPDSSRQNFAYARFPDALLAVSAAKHGLRRFLDALLTSHQKQEDHKRSKYPFQQMSMCTNMNKGETSIYQSLKRNIYTGKNAIVQFPLFPITSTVY
jgi:hypothetical protein